MTEPLYCKNCGRRADVHDERQCQRFELLSEQETIAYRKRELGNPQAPKLPT